MSIVVIDPGHGGQQPAGRSTPFGVRGPAGTLEKEVTTRLAKRVAHHLGARAVLTREGDTNLSLAERANASRRHGASVFVSLHANQGPTRRERGAETYVHARASRPSRSLANAVQRSLARLGGAGGGVQSADLAVLTPDYHSPRTAACLVEVDFLSSPDGERCLRDPAALDRMGRAIAGAIDDHLGAVRYGGDGDEVYADDGEPYQDSDAASGAGKRYREAITTILRKYEGGTCAGEPDFDALFPPAEQKNWPVGYTTCNDFSNRVQNLAAGPDAANVRLKLAARKDLTSKQRGAATISAPLCVGDKDYLQAQIDAGSFHPASPGMSERPKVGDIIIQTFAENVMADGKIKNYKGSFAHVGTLSQEIVTNDDGSETWTSVDGGQRSGDKAAILQVTKKYWPDQNRFSRLDQTTPTGYAVFGWIDVEKLAEEP
jgi:hypothetical protein